MLIAIILASAVITAGHGAMLAYAQKRQHLPREKRHALWKIHAFALNPLWALLFLAIIGAQFSFANGMAPFWQVVSGVIVITAGIALFIAARKNLGLPRAMGRRFFFPEEETAWLASGAYRRLANPMYDAFALILLGLGIALNSWQDLALAAVSLILLNGLLTRLENRGHPWRFF